MDSLISLVTHPLFGLPLWAWVLCLYVVLRQLRTRGRPGVTWFRKSRNRPALYIFASAGEPDLVKVGYTSRMTEKRQAELERSLGARLILVRRIRMPHAWVAEQWAHHALRAKGWQLPWERGLGGEWYLVPGPKGLDELIRITTGCARGVETQARRRFAWAEGAEVTIHDGPGRPRPQ